MKRRIALCIGSLLVRAVCMQAQMTMIYYGHLNVNSNGADGYSNAVVPYGVVHSSVLELSEDGNTVDSDSGGSVNTGQSVYLSVSFFGYPDPYTLYELAGEAEGEIADYGWFLDWFYYSDVTAPPTVTLTSAGDTYDGASGSFDLSVQGGFPSAYDWSYSAPPSAGNNPQVTFNGSGASVSSDAHWFAYPNGECAANFSSQYQITGQALIANQWYWDTTQFTIYVPNPGGETYSPTVMGTVQVLCSNGVCTVGANNFYRTQSVSVIDVLPSSQFRVKVETHEANHVHQHTAGMFSQYWDPLTAYNRVRNFTDTSYSALSARITAEANAYNAEQDAAVQSLWPLAEILAYSVSNSIPPFYLFQSTCGGQ